MRLMLEDHSENFFGLFSSAFLPLCTYYIDVSSTYNISHIKLIHSYLGRLTIFLFFLVEDMIFLQILASETPKWYRVIP